MMTCPECGAANFLGLDILCSTCAGKLKQEKEAAEAESHFEIFEIGYESDSKNGFKTQEEAEIAALHESFTDSAWVVYDNDTEETLSIAYCGEVFSK